VQEHQGGESPQGQRELRVRIRILHIEPLSQTCDGEERL
jgi:hypothetical protein